jgi:hypothetical protein
LQVQPLSNIKDNFVNCRFVVISSTMKEVLLSNIKIIAKISVNDNGKVKGKVVPVLN